MSNELKEAKFGLLKWIDVEAEGNQQTIQIDDETGKAFHWDWEESFDRAREKAIDQISDFQSDYDLTDEETDQLREWAWTLHANSYGTILDRMRKEKQQEQVEKILDLVFGTAA